jgi:O-antigen ligase
MIDRQPLQELIANADRRMVALALGVALALVAAVLGLALALIGPIYTLVLLVALAGVVWVIAGLENALWSVVAVITLLPFATLPIKVVLTPTFLDLAMAAAYFLYLMQWMTGERRRLATTPVHPFIVLFAVLSVFSFVAGLRYAGLTSRVLRSFAELLMSVGFALVLVDVLRTPEQLRRFVLVVVLMGTLAALGGVVLWLMPDSLAERILVRLSVIGYPDGGVIQYIEQNPALPERAISTTVNPNALGGLLVMIAALAAPQLITRYPLTGRRWHAVPILLALVICLVLTFSRGSMAAFGVAILFIAALRYRKLLVVLAVVGVVLLALPWSQVYIERFIEGLQGADLATQMRFGEYKDALILIRRYPLLGVGFAGAPDIDIYLGASSVYLVMAENMGLLGLGAFLILMVVLFAYAWRARPHLDTVPGLRPMWLGLVAGLIGALFNGILDHYFFNLEFHAAITIFWTFVGLALAATRIALEAGEGELVEG